MAIKQDGGVVRQFHALFRAGTTGDLTDGQLLERFAAEQGEVGERAFATLVERHGPLVFRTCRGVLGNDHDAQDAFQATFLVLLRKSHALWASGSLAPWLQQAAYHAARCARTAGLRRRVHERRAVELMAARASAPVPAPAAVAAEEAEAVLHEEIARLPERYRVPLVICDLGGSTHEHAAEQLGCPVGTIKSRLARGRERLRDRLTRRGLVPGPGLVIVATTRTLPPPELIDSTARAASEFAAAGATAACLPARVSSLVKGVLTAMHHGKSRIPAATMLVLTAAVTGGVLVAGTRAPEPGPRVVSGSGSTPRVTRPPDGQAARQGARVLHAVSRAEPAPSVPKARIRHVDRLDLGPLRVDALAEAEVSVRFSGVKDPGMAIEIDGPEFVTVKNLRVFRRGAESPGEVYCGLSLVIDTKTAGKHSGALGVRLDQQATKIPVVANIRPKAAGESRVLVVSGGFGGESSTAEYYRPWFDLVAEAKLDVSYMEGLTGLDFPDWRTGRDGRPMLPDELARYDVIFLVDGGPIHPNEVANIMLERFVESGKRLIVTASPGMGRSAQNASEILRPHGMEMLLDEATRRLGPDIITSDEVIADRLTQGIGKLSTFRPALIAIKDGGKAKLLAPLRGTGKGFVAVSRPGKGEVVAIGVALIPSWIGEHGKDTDNARFLRSLLSKPER